VLASDVRHLNLRWRRFVVAKIFDLLRTRGDGGLYTTLEHEGHRPRLSEESFTILVGARRLGNRRVVVVFVELSAKEHKAKHSDRADAEHAGGNHFFFRWDCWVKQLHCFKSGSKFLMGRRS